MIRFKELPMTYWQQTFIDWNRRRRMFRGDAALVAKCRTEALSALYEVRFQRNR
jgi:hypothetical protein